MKPNVFVCLMITFFISCQDSYIHQSSDFNCIITSSKQTYKLGETPKIKVEIINKSEYPTYLVYSIDGSERGRSPRCKFTIEKPVLDSLPPVGFCGNTNPLKESNFIYLDRKASFNPYGRGHDGYSYAFPLVRKENFRNPGIYNITFQYSTDGFEYNLENEKYTGLRKLIKQIPNINLVSNTVEIEIEE